MENNDGELSNIITSPPLWLSRLGKTVFLMAFVLTIGLLFYISYPNIIEAEMIVLPNANKTAKSFKSPNKFINTPNQKLVYVIDKETHIGYIYIPKGHFTKINRDQNVSIKINIDDRPMVINAHTIYRNRAYAKNEVLVFVVETNKQELLNFYKRVETKGNTNVTIKTEPISLLVRLFNDLITPSAE